MMRCSLALLLALLAGCAPTAARYTAVPAAPASSVRAAVAAPAAPTGDAELDAFLASTAAALDRKDWREIALRLDPPTYADLHDAAIAAGATNEAAAAALIADALGLSALAGSDDAPFAGLDRIRVVTLRSASEMSGGVVHVRGDVRLDDDSRLDLNAFVRQASGRYRLVLSRV